MRDNQRQRVYDAENTVTHGADRLDEVRDIEKFLKRITKSAWYKRRFTRWATIEVKDGRRRRRACGSSSRGYINMPRWSRTRKIVLHEVAHVVQPSCTAWHGREFCKIYLALVKKWIGREAYDALKAAFKEHGVKYVTGAVKV